MPVRLGPVHVARPARSILRCVWNDKQKYCQLGSSADNRMKIGCVIRAAHQRARFHMCKSHFAARLFVLVEFHLGDVTNNGQMFY